MAESTKLDIPAEERTLVAQVKIYYDVALPFEPVEPNQSPGKRAKPRPLLIALHGYGENKRRMMREARLCAPENFALCSLQGVHQHFKKPKEKGGALRYGFGWLTNFHPEESVALHHRALLDVIEQLVDEGVADTGKIFLLGFSQTCALNFRFAFTHADSLRGVVGICGGIPGDWDQSEKYRQTRASVLYLSGERDEFYPPERVHDFVEKLHERSSDVEAESYDAGHEIAPAMRERVRAWLESRSRE
ncbi:MAG TPA: dienelactone hydrolase family protein [Pyrinomonadaceae bacterium]|nr:dienelactone hydrolase family protein [Pyrinomonadaceae bacterium]